MYLTEFKSILTYSYCAEHIFFAQLSTLRPVGNLLETIDTSCPDKRLPGHLPAGKQAGNRTEMEMVPPTEESPSSHPWQIGDPAGKYGVK